MALEVKVRIDALLVGGSCGLRPAQKINQTETFRPNNTRFCPDLINIQGPATSLWHDGISIKRLERLRLEIRSGTRTFQICLTGSVLSGPALTIFVGGVKSSNPCSLWSRSFDENFDPKQFPIVLNSLVTCWVKCCQLTKKKQQKLK